MSALTCGFCGRMSAQIEGWHQIFDRPVTRHDGEDMHMVCPKCYDQFIKSNLGAVVDPELEFDAVREAMDDDNPGKNYIGMTLRDFLCSGMYLQTQNIYFQDRDGIDVKDYMNVMDVRVLDIEQPDEHERIRVVLDMHTD